MGNSEINVYVAMNTLRPVIFFIAAIMLSDLYCLSQENTLNYSEELSAWHEVSNSIVAQINSQPAFGAFCLWEVSSVSGNPIPYPKSKLLKLWPPMAPLNNANKSEESLVPGSVIKVADGWLVACNWADGSEVCWFSEDKSTRKLVAEVWINQFQKSSSDGVVIAAQGEWIGYNERGGRVSRFHRSASDQNWSHELLVNYQFGEVLGVAPGWEDGILVYSRRGWWKIDTDGEVALLWNFRDLYVGGRTIAIGENDTVFVGGKHFVKQVNLKTKTVKMLVPSKEFLAAMLEWPHEKFQGALEKVSVIPLEAE